MAVPDLAGTDIVGLDARAVRASVQVVSQASAADLARPTPCADWTLADLLAHMTAQHNGFAAAAAGDGADLVRWQTGAPAADPVAEYAAAAERVLAAFAAAGVLTRKFALPLISTQLRFPAAEAIGFHFVDYVVHGWDVARALGLGYGLEPDVLAGARPIAWSVPDGERRRRPAAAFAPRVAMTGGSVLDEIVALLGRRPDWPGLPPPTWPAGLRPPTCASASQLTAPERTSGTSRPHRTGPRPAAADAIPYA